MPFSLGWMSSVGRKRRSMYLDSPGTSNDRSTLPKGDKSSDRNSFEKASIGFWLIDIEWNHLYYFRRSVKTIVPFVMTSDALRSTNIPLFVTAIVVISTQISSLLTSIWVVVRMTPFLVGIVKVFWVLEGRSSYCLSRSASRSWSSSLWFARFRIHHRNTLFRLIPVFGILSRLAKFFLME